MAKYGKKRQKIVVVLSALCLFFAACSSNSTVTCKTELKQEDEDVADWEVTTKVKASILADSKIGFTARFISVKTKDGTVTLTGHVSRVKDRDRIVKITKKISGVRCVDNQITIQDPS